MPQILRFKLVLIFLCGLLHESVAQPFARNWHFGNQSGLNFSTGAPQGQNVPGFQAFEGSSSISDSVTGNLLFYTNGENIWHGGGGFMANGTGLRGKQTASQNSLILPFPGQPSRYILFTLGATYDTAGLSYSIIDMSLNGGQGGVVTGQKNINILPGNPPALPLAEKLTATRHCNGVDWWVMGHFIGTNAFFRIPVTGAGIGVIVNQAIGAVHPAPVGANLGANKGYMRFSPDGTRLAVATAQRSNNVLQLFRFDKSNGQLSDPITLPTMGGEYAVAFSPDNGKLFVTSSRDSVQGTNTRYFNNVMAFDMLATNIPGSRVTVKSKLETVVGKYGAIQNASDGRMYVAQEFRDHLHSIVDPAGFGASNQFTDTILILPSGTSRLGLPNFVDDQFSKPFTANFSFSFVCIGNPMQFRDSTLSNAISWQWDFDRANPGTATSTLRNPTHTYTTPGTYNVRLIADRGCGVLDTIEKPVTIGLNLPVDLGSDTAFICVGDTLNIGSNVGTATYQWFTGSPGSWLISPNDTTNTLRPSTSGWYRLTADNGACDGEDSIYVLINNTPVDVNLGNDILLCPGATVTIDAGNPGSTYLWSTGATSQTISVSVADTFWVTASFQGCTDTDTVIVFADSLGRVNVMNDTTLCPEIGELLIDASAFGVAFLWSTGSLDPVLTVEDTGTYSVIINTAAGCLVTDTILVSYSCPTQVLVPNAFTPNGDNLNDTFKPLLTAVDVGYEFLIYNRWGQRVYFTNNVADGWNGKVNGTDAEEGYYSYVIRYFTNVERVFTIKTGQVYLYR